ncbi:protein Cep78 homolog [Leguminivora glycinivorella]|uniref:protein Cep78 homolog n=1 Tax=Leguminivora glycinivorella TaxID=1035111 RepID=UPI00200CC5AD|nr:protein Cep78 homolog [Leguminivora glycinivorella]
MVGKGETKNSRIFHQSYVKCCKLQNLTPLNNVIPSANGKVLDFCVDRIKYVEWPPILNALSCDLSLHSVAIRCRQQVKTVLEQIDCERLAKTVNKRAVILTKFMLSNLVEAVAQLLADTTLLHTLILEGLPLRIPYLNPISEVLTSNNSLSHLALPRCLIGDAGCMAVCKAVRCLPNILTLDLSGCELTPLGASYIADLIKYQKINRYSENWVHTLRYRMPELDAMAGLRRISLCGNPLGDAGASALLSVIADDLWIKAMDLQSCEATESTAAAALLALQSNTTLVVLDLRHNSICGESLAKVRAAVRKNETGVGEQYSWLGSTSMCSGDGIRVIKPMSSRNGVSKDRAALNQKIAPMKHTINKTTVNKREKDYAEVLEQQLQDEVAHRQQLEELNSQLVEQMKQLQQQQLRRWQDAESFGSEQSLEASSRSGSSGSSCSVPIDQSTLSYIQQAFRDIYAFIKNNQCAGNCEHEPKEHITEIPESDEERSEDRASIIPKKAQSTHVKLTELVKVEKMTKSAHLLGHIQHIRETMQIVTKPEMIEKQMGDTKNIHKEEQYLDELQEMNSCTTKSRKDSMISRNSRSSGSLVSDSSDTLVSSHNLRARASPHRAHSPRHKRSPRRVRHTPRDAPSPPRALNPREALYSSSDDSS